MAAGDNLPVTVRLEPELVEKLDALAEATARSRSFLLSEAIAQYVAVNEWQVQKIKEAVAAADRGEFASDQEVQRVFKKLKRRAG